MTSIANASSTTVPAPPLTARTRAVIPPDLLQQPLGESTVGAALDTQIRFRVTGNDDPAKVRLVPDSRLAEELLASGSGPKLQRMAQRMVETAGDTGANVNFKGLVFPRDTESAAASILLTGLERMPAAERDAIDGAKLVQESMEVSQLKMTRAGGWNGGGWITFAPDTARAILTGVGAYTPKPDETRLRKAGAHSDYISGHVVHEFQHSVSPPSPTSYNAQLGWLEEGTANLFSRTPQVQGDTQRSIPFNRHSYAGHLGAPDHFDPGWGSWHRPQLTPDQKASNAQRSSSMYTNSQDTIRGLLDLGGISMDTPEGFEQARDVLQGKSLLYVPGSISDAIIEHNDLDPSVRERLRTKVKAANDSPAAFAAVQQFVAEAPRRS